MLYADSTLATDYCFIKATTTDGQTHVYAAHGDSLYTAAVDAIRAALGECRMVWLEEYRGSLSGVLICPKAGKGTGGLPACGQQSLLSAVSRELPRGEAPAKGEACKGPFHPSWGAIPYWQ